MVAVQVQIQRGGHNNGTTVSHYSSARVVTETGLCPAICSGKRPQGSGATKNIHALLFDTLPMKTLASSQRSGLKTFLYGRAN